MAHSIGTEIRHVKPALTSVLVLVSVIAAIFAFAILMTGVGRSVPVRPAVLHNAQQEARCLQFVESARSEFGPEWKRRIDPGNTACAQQIQTAWERDWTPRQALPAPVLPQTITANVERPAKIAPPEAVPDHDADAYSPAKAAIIASAHVADSNVPDQDVAIDSENGAAHSGDAGSSETEDLDEGDVGDSEQGHAPRRSSSEDTGGNDGQADDTRELDNQQLIRHGWPHDADMQRWSDDDLDADEDVDIGDSAEY